MRLLYVDLYSITIATARHILFCSNFAWNSGIIGVYVIGIQQAISRSSRMQEICTPILFIISQGILYITVKNVRVISTLSIGRSAQLHLFRGFYNSTRNAVLTTAIKIYW